MDPHVNYESKAAGNLKSAGGERSEQMTTHSIGPPDIVSSYRVDGNENASSVQFRVHVPRASSGVMA